MTAIGQLTSSLRGQTFFVNVKQNLYSTKLQPFFLLDNMVRNRRRIRKAIGVKF